MKALLLFVMTTVAAQFSSAHSLDGHYHPPGDYGYYAPVPYCGSQPCDFYQNLNQHPPFPQYPGHGRLCAKVFQGAGFTGAVLPLFDKVGISRLSSVPMYYGYSADWNNKISSLEVYPGCTLKVFQYDNYGVHYGTGQLIGANKAYGGYDYVYQLRYLNDLISSLSCSCR